MTASTSSTSAAEAAARAPRRVFLCDAAVAATADHPEQHRDATPDEVEFDPLEGEGGADHPFDHSAGRMTRLMGIVVAVEGGVGGDADRSRTLVIDDGTGYLVRVVVEIPTTTASRPRSTASMGDLVDCLVSLRRVRRDDGTALTETLVASSVAVVSDPNAEVLRNLEISAGYQSSSSSGPWSVHSDRDGGNDDRRPFGGRPDDTNNVLVPDSLRSSAGSDGGMGGDDVLRLIRAAASDGGVTERDLALVLGLVTPTERRRCSPEPAAEAIAALRRTLDGLHAEGLVYRRRSSSTAACGGDGHGGYGSSTDGSDRGGVYLPL